MYTEACIGVVSVCVQVTQLTGFSDPVYAEAYVNVNQYDIVLDVLIVNQTADTLQNLTLELATLGTLVEHGVCLTGVPVFDTLAGSQTRHICHFCLDQTWHAFLHTFVGSQAAHAFLHTFVCSQARHTILHAHV